MGTSYHSVDIRAFYDQEGRSKRIKFNFLPDSIRIPLRNSFNRNPIPLTSSQFLIYEHTEVPVISFMLTIVNGLDKMETGGVISDARDSIENSGDTFSRNYSAEFQRLCRHLYSLSAPMVAGHSNSRPPPRCVLQFGGIFRATGAFENIELEYKGPWDYDGSPLEVDATFTFLPTQFYDSDNPTGINFVSGVDESTDVEVITKEASGMEEKLKHAPSMDSLEKPEDLDAPFIIYYGEPQQLRD